MTTSGDLAGTSWKGTAELWLDPLGNVAATSECTVKVGESEVSYTWAYEGEPHQGRLALRAGGADFTDTFHSSTAMPCAAVPSTWALVDVFGTYEAGDGPPWGWRIAISQRPGGGEIVIQMTNVKPWGEDGRAVRMVAKRA